MTFFSFLELVGEKFPGTEREAINIKIGHLLKPSGTNQLCTRQKDDGARQNNDDD